MKKAIHIITAVFSAAAFAAALIDAAGFIEKYNSTGKT